MRCSIGDMGRKALSEDARLKLICVSLPLGVKTVIEKMASAENRSISQTARYLLEESPRLRSQLRKNGKGK